MAQTVNPSARVLIGSSRAMEGLRASIREAAATDMTVLIQGETGTGKELVARAIHEVSRRAGCPFVAMNCASVQESLVESELFGHEKGAFTGAETMKKGRFEQADSGTLFLDEIGEISLGTQAKILRVLQEHEIDRVGGHGPVPIDFRLIAATNRNLEEMARAGKFRDDLYYRLNVDLIRTPTLRERPDDIAELAHHFSRHYGRRASSMDEIISPEVLHLFRNYRWPGNVRELQNVVQRAVHAGDGDIMELEHLPPDLYRKAARAKVVPRSYQKAMNDLSRRLCLWALEAAHGNWRGAARLLEMNRTTFYRVAKGHGLVNLMEVSDERRS